MLKIPTIVCGEPMPIRFRQEQKVTTSQTALTGVWVKEFTLLQKLANRVNYVSNNVVQLSQSLPRKWQCFVSCKGVGHASVRQHSGATREKLH